MKVSTLVQVIFFVSLELCKAQYYGKQKRSPVECSPNTFFQHPDPEDCTKFYKCDSSMNPIKFSCPSGLHYNPNNNVCDWPKDAGCQVNINPVTCPSVKSGTTVRIKDPKDSQSYYVCGSNGVPLSKTCPPSTTYDDYTMKCKNEKTASQNQDNQTRKTQDQNKGYNNQINGKNNDITNSNQGYNWDDHW